MERGSVAAGGVRRRAGTALRHRGNWVQLAQFCVVGLSGYAVNLVVFTALVRALEVHYLVAAVASFLVAVANNYSLNRAWTFRRNRGHVGVQGARFLVVSTAALAANLVALAVLVRLGLDEIVAQALAIALVTPVNFAGNKLWSFRH
jgi:putative flippase GtrA